MATIVYIDGFNFYYGAVKGTPYKWLDLEKLCRLLLPRDDIVKIRYFTAMIRERSHDPEQVVRQQAYLRALATLKQVPVTALPQVQFPTIVRDSAGEIHKPSGW